MGRLNESAQPSLSFNTLQDYQQWADKDWIFESGSEEAQGHFRSKLEEEASELSEALESHQPDEIISELGDVLWTASANARTSGISIEDSFRHSFHDGTFDDNPIPVAKIDEIASEFVDGQSIKDIASRLNYLSGYLGRAAKQWRNLSPLIDTKSQPATFSEAWILLKAGRAKGSLAEIFLISSALAQQGCGKSLQEVMEANAQKLLARKAAGEPLTKLPE